MRPSWALLLDLDQTLVLTDTIKAYRIHPHWKTIQMHFDKTVLPLHTLAFLERVRPYIQLGIVTSSPRTYAEMLVSYHRLAMPVLVAYHDTPRGTQKPAPDPLLLAAKQLDILPAYCIHVGDQAEDIIAAYRAGMIAIGLSWDERLDTTRLVGYPYTLCDSWFDVLTQLKKARKKGNI